MGNLLDWNIPVIWLKFLGSKIPSKSRRSINIKFIKINVGRERVYHLDKLYPGRYPEHLFIFFGAVPRWYIGTKIKKVGEKSVPENLEKKRPWIFWGAITRQAKAWAMPRDGFHMKRREGEEAD